MSTGYIQISNFNKLRHIPILLNIMENIFYNQVINKVNILKKSRNIVPGLTKWIY